MEDFDSKLKEALDNIDSINKESKVIHLIDPRFKYTYGNNNTPRGFEQFNEDWAISPNGDIVFRNWCFDIQKEKLNRSDWFLHLMEKEWFDANTFIPAYFEACRRAGIETVSIKVKL